VMEYLEGRDLQTILNDSGTLAVDEAVEYVLQACEAIAEAHSAGVVHRDLKPANLFILKDAGESSLKLLDFGVAMALSDTLGDGERRQKGFAIFGTPEYMAPEQVAGEPVDGRCDIYALGCVLYELVTGRRPFEGGSSVVVMGKQLRELPEPPRMRAPQRGIPVELDAIVMKALAKKPEDRFASASEMREALEAAMLRPIEKKRKMQRMVGGAAAFVAMIAVGSFVAKSGFAHALTPSDARVAFDQAIPPAHAEAPIEDLQLPKAHSSIGFTPVALDLQAAIDDKPIRAPKIAATESLRPRQTRDADKNSDRGKDQDRDRDKAKLADARSDAESHPDDSRVLQAWANAAFKAGDYREAKRATEAWSLKDGTPEPRIFLATVLDALGRRADARAVLEEVLDLHPDSAEARKLHAHFGAPLPSLDTGGRKSVAHR
ncbi:MAG: protein kinase domain-containing protein, partial [Polyangiaceae bacterium]